MKKLKKIFSFFIIMFSFTLYSACTDNNSSSRNDINTVEQTKEELQQKTSQYTFIHVNEEFTEDIDLIEKYLDEFSSSQSINNDNLTLEKIKTDTFTIIEYYSELDNLYITAFSQADTIVATYNDRCDAALEDLQLYRQQHPNYYKGSYEQYLEERSVYSKEIQKAETELQLGQKYWPETAQVYGWDYVNNMINKLKNTISKNGQKLEELDSQWEQREIIDAYILQIAELENIRETKVDELLESKAAEMITIENKIMEIMAQYSNDEVEI